MANFGLDRLQCKPEYRLCAKQFVIRKAHKNHGLFDRSFLPARNAKMSLASTCRDSLFPGGDGEGVPQVYLEKNRSLRRHRETVSRNQVFQLRNHSTGLAVGDLFNYPTIFKSLISPVSKYNGGKLSTRWVPIQFDTRKFSQTKHCRVTTRHFHSN
jgi:hypothetical protein